MDRQERRYRTRAVVWKRIREAKIFGIPLNPKLQGRLKKVAPCDCGHTKCFCCHPDKILDNPTRQELDSIISLKEQIEEIDN